MKLKKRTEEIINTYYPEGHPAREIYLEHVKAVKKACIKIAKHNKHLTISKKKLKAMAMLHDIGIFQTNAPDIGCYGNHRYLEHGYIGRAILEHEGLQEIAAVCERHIGVGITKKEIIEKDLPLPHREMMPRTNEERIVCFADKFFSKTSKNLSKPKSMERILSRMKKLGKTKAFEFTKMAAEFGFEYLYEQKNSKTQA